MNSIPASDIVQILPGVVGTGGNPLALNALFITKKKAESMLGVRSFGSEDEVGEVFGIDSDEYRATQIYFAGFVNSTSRPESLYIAYMNGEAESAKLIGSKVPVRTESDFSPLPSDLTLTIDDEKVSVTIDDEVTSYSALAQAATTSLGAKGQCAYDALSQTFVISGATKGAKGNISFAVGDLAEFMGLTESSSAQKNDGIDADSIEELMPRITKETRNFVSVMTLGDFSVSEKLTISRWVSLQNDRYIHVLYHSNDDDLKTISDAIIGAEVGGTMLMYGDYTHGAFVCGYPACLNFDELNGRTNLSFRYQEGLAPSVDEKSKADELMKLGFNFYGAYGTANDRFIFVYPGSISGKFKFMDSYVNQVFFNSQLQIALMTMLVSNKSVPYNDAGRAMHRAAVTDPANQMLNFGGIQPGVELSEQQKKQINYEAGFDAVSQLKTAGWCIRVGETPAQTRGLRKSMPLKLWYADGGSVQKVNLPSINVQ